MKYLTLGHAVAQLAEALRYQPESREFDSRLYRLEFFFDMIVSATLVSAKPTKKIFFALHVSIIMESESLNILETSGTVLDSKGNTFLIFM